MNIRELLRRKIGYYQFKSQHPYFVEHNLKKEKKLFQACQEGNFSIVQQCLRRGTNPNVIDQATLLNAMFHALQSPNMDIITELVNYGGNLDVELHGQCLLDTVCKAGNTEMLQHLLLLGIDLQHMGSTVIDKCLSYRQLSVLWLLATTPMLPTYRPILLYQFDRLGITVISYAHFKYWNQLHFALYGGLRKITIKLLRQGLSLLPKQTSTPTVYGRMEQEHLWKLTHPNCLDILSQILCPWVPSVTYLYPDQIQSQIIWWWWIYHQLLSHYPKLFMCPWLHIMQYLVPSFE